MVIHWLTQYVLRCHENSIYIKSVVYEGIATEANSQPSLLFVWIWICFITCRNTVKNYFPWLHHTGLESITQGSCDPFPTLPSWLVPLPLASPRLVGSSHPLSTIIPRPSVIKLIVWKVLWLWDTVALWLSPPLSQREDTETTRRYRWISRFYW